MIYKNGERMHDFLGLFIFIGLVFYILGAFLIERLFHSRLLDMKSQRYAPRWLSIIS